MGYLIHSQLSLKSVYETVSRDTQVDC